MTRIDLHTHQKLTIDENSELRLEGIKLKQNEILATRLNAAQKISKAFKRKIDAKVERAMEAEK